MTGRLLTLLRLELTIDHRWAVGTWPDAKASIQLPVLLDPRRNRATGSRPYLPGTSLAGSLRRHLLDHRGPEAAREWLGPEIGAREESTGTLSDAAANRVGRLVLLGCLPIEARVESRGSTRIDSARGAAHGTSQRAEQWAEPTTVTLALEHDGSRDPDLLNSLRVWRPVIGRARTSGLGQARVTALTSLQLDLDDEHQFSWWLTERDAWLRGAGRAPSGVTVEGGAVSTKAHQPALPPWSLIVREPVHIGTGQDPETDGDGRRQTPSLHSRDRLVIPGSSWKGVFHHRVEVILRVLGASDQERGVVLGHLFGAEGRRGHLLFRDSVTSVQRGDSRTHVAIDRFTGGARTSALHQVVAIPEGTTLELTIDAAGEVPTPVRTLLEHVVTDLHDGLVTVGGHGTRGYGWVRRAGTAPTGPEPVDVSALVASCSPSTPKEAS